jgi:hypothetical protein
MYGVIQGFGRLRKARTGSCRMGEFVHVQEPVRGACAGAVRGACAGGWEAAVD